MEPMSIFSAVLGLSPPWQVTSVTFAKESNRLDICVEFKQSYSLICSACQAKGIICHAELKTEAWHRNDFFGYDAYLFASVPHLVGLCGLFPLERPWCRESTRFVRVL